MLIKEQEMKNNKRKKSLFESYVLLLLFPYKILLYRIYLFNPSNTIFLIEIIDNENKECNQIKC